MVEPPAPYLSTSTPRYSGFDALLLAEIIEAQSPLLPKKPFENYFEDYVLTTLFAPFKITRSRITRLAASGAVGDSDEVLYDANHPWIWWNHQLGAPVGSLAPGQYDATPAARSYANGLWAMPAIDVARLFSSFDITPNPVYNADSLKLLLDPNIAPGPPFQGPPDKRPYGRSLAFYFWDVWLGGAPAIWHNGDVNGGSALAFRKQVGPDETDTLTIAATLSLDEDDAIASPFAFGPDGVVPFSYNTFWLAYVLAKAALKTDPASWPTTPDLFQNYGMDF